MLLIDKACAAWVSIRLAMPDLGYFIVLGALGLMIVVVLLFGVTLWLTQEDSERLTPSDPKQLPKGFLREIAGLVRWLVYLLLALAGLFVPVRFMKRLFVAA